jgi:hypothetical protein
MTSNDASVRQAAGWPELRSGPLLAGGILTGIGALLALAGAGVVITHVVTATRAWINELETPPDQLARLKWEQAKTAVAAGAASWQKHPNAGVRLARRESARA